MTDVERVSSVRFSAVARALADEARRRGLTAPAFRSPPRVEGAPRTIRRMGDRTVVAVRLRGRRADDVAVDMVEGVVVANGLDGAAAARCREELHAALAGVLCVSSAA